MQLLGTPQVRVGSRWHRFFVDQRYQLLAYLAYRGEALSREHLAFLFWPDTAPKLARQNLRKLLQRVRSLDWLEGLVAEAQTVAWPVETDVASLRRALAEGSFKRVVDLYQGPLLAGLEGDGAGEFSAWLEVERAELGSRWRDALVERASELEAGGDSRGAALLYESLLTHDALDEEALASFLRLAGDSGLRDRALKAYGDFAVQLKVELELEPTPATELLARTLREQRGESASKVEAHKRLPASAQGGRARRPALATPFIGREIELAELTHLLLKPECRLLTVTGQGGVGKTRVALQAMSTLAAKPADGVCFAPLESLASAKSIPASVADALGLTLQGSDDPHHQLASYLRDKELILILDNFEHITEGALALAEWLDACPKLKALVTSRERLNVDEEWLLPLEGLPYPAGPVSLEEAQAFDAVKLFVERARRDQPQYALSEQELPYVLDICRSVEGLPLAIELAAVWVRKLSCAEIAEELKRNVDFLATTSVNPIERHKGLRATFEHSWRLLSHSEQRALRRLAVFRGGFRKEAAAVVAGASIAMLSALLDKSLLRSSPNGRYDRHPLLHQYMLEKLAGDQSELREMQDKHLKYYLSVAEKAEPHLTGAQQAALLNQFEEEHDNYRAALDHSLSSRQEELGQRLAAAIGRFWDLRCHYAEGRERLKRLLKPPRTGAGRAAYGTALHWAAVLAQRQGDYAAALACFGECLRIKRKLGDNQAIAALLNSQGLIAKQQGDYARARALFEKGLAVSRSSGDRRNVGLSLKNLGLAAAEQGDYGAARALLEESLQIFRGLADRQYAAAVLDNLGILASEQGDHPTARLLYEEAIAISREVGNKQGLALTLNNLGLLTHEQGDYVKAEEVFKESLAIFRELGSRQGIAFALNNLGMVARRQGDYALARARFNESLALKRELGDWQSVANSLGNLGTVALQQGDCARARSLFEEGVSVRRDLGDRLGMAKSLESFASLAAAEGHAERAVRLWGAAEALREELGAPVPPNQRHEYGGEVAAICGQLEEDRFSALWAEGRALSLAAAIRCAVENVAPQPRAVGKPARRMRR